MKEVPFPLAKARRRTRVTREPWKKPDPFHISVEERRRTLLQGRPVLFWKGTAPAPEAA